MKFNNPSWYSSYEENNYGDFFYALMRIYQPEKVVELGTKNGYSAYHMARGLKENGHGTLDCYDLWENHIGNLGSGITKSAAEENLKEFKSIITLNLASVVGVEKKYQGVDILHVDLDNDGQILEKIVPGWLDKVRQVIIIEGGSSERDAIDLTTTHKKMPVDAWLNDLSGHQAKTLKKIVPETDQADQFVIVEGDNKYKKQPIAKWLQTLSQRQKDIEYITIKPFPSVTIISRRWLQFIP